jgi:hypothetical protein
MSRVYRNALLYAIESYAIDPNATEPNTIERSRTHDE